MAKRYRFRKVYFVCRDNSIFSDTRFVNCFRSEAHAREQAIVQQRNALENSQMLWEKDKAIPKFKAHGFYLVHESLIDELLKGFTEEK
ncbi:MAG: hypothetical protein K0S09_1418 [Sphingobacteriaceae bacterium]|jgi:hypothetical protein|nr:hypothetical protein [Sphingobacteriaceae bacterium]